MFERVRNCASCRFWDIRNLSIVAADGFIISACTQPPNVDQHEWKRGSDYCSHWERKDEPCDHAG